MSAFLLTWRDIHWPYTRIERMVQIFGRKGYVIEPWKIFAHEQAKKGGSGMALETRGGRKNYIRCWQPIGCSNVQTVRSRGSVWRTYQI
jgi:hypothetical protein